MSTKRITVKPEGIYKPKVRVTSVKVVSNDLQVEDRIMLGNVQKGNEIAQKHGECPICFGKLAEKQTCAFVKTKEGHEKRVCPHYLHLDCMSNLLISECPVCDASFTKSVPVPRPETNAEEWFRFVDVDGNGRLTKTEVVNVFAAQLSLDVGQLSSTLDKLWSKWDTNNNGTISMEEMLKPKTGLLSFVLKARGLDQNNYTNLPNLKDTESFFAFWDEDGSGELEKEEVVRAIVKTYHLEFKNFSRVAAVRGVVEAVWGLFDHDGNGGVSRKEYCARDGLGDTLAAQLKFEE